ncbi:hypothetical protein NQ317_003150 [Molorchus minor]|uniref:T-cell activation inhibitor n=1 Tax=Molorchus minor TaxID=1323400 RepID=A0ABQ9K1G2_9CUCU|nr:hypothetical protein NQ317_003150 [Molorchus minor]
MFRTVQHLFTSYQNILPCFRNLSSTEVSTALRPFYFSVHPDLFGQYPNERAVNESSLQQLSMVIANLQASKPVRPIQLLFYIKDKAQPGGPIRSINIYIKEREIRSVITNILKSCGLSTAYVDGVMEPHIAEPNVAKFKVKYKYDIDLTRVNKNHPIFAHVIMEKKIRDAREAQKLSNWLRTNFNDALEKSKKSEALREDVEKIREKITKDLELKEIRWACGWNDTHFRGSLLSFRSLIEQHPQVRHVLKGRILIFSSCTGISLDGHIMLYSGEVRHNWLDFLKNIRKYDMALLRIPAFEKSLSHVLRNIKIGRRKFMPKVEAETYEHNLMQITTSLADYQSRMSFPKEWPESLKDYEIVVETESGPLMVSPTGQFIVPSTLPGTILINFISNNLKEANERNRSYQSDKYLERSLIAECKQQFQLGGLVKDDNITPELMIKSCKKLLESKNDIQHYLKGVRLNISTYYSVLSDGVMCIPWNYDL